MASSNAAKSASRREQLRAAREREAAAARRKRIIIATVVVVIIAALVAVIAMAASGVFSSKSGSSTKGTATTVSVRPPNASPGDKGVFSADNTNNSAPVLTVVDDFQCPACHQYETVYGPVFESLAKKGEIRLEYRTRYFLDINLKNDSSVRAARAAAIADTFGKYQEYHDTVFSNQPSQEGVGYTDDQLRNSFPQAAGITGDDLAKFQSSYDKGEMNAFVDAVDKNASADGYNSTPTFLSNDKQIKFTNSAPTEDYVMQIVKAA
ncbi:DSBA oxidoreductase [Propionibacterium freudenreichii]|uniref:DsbA family protein n=1 Tax=Propionibacterium freudenreichii TaxID=1744 RepID=UPI0005A5CA2C|nr:thioredoxin domain-containing protein [Propionibacterium freudenreichii]CEI26877.1 DSBA oxidoreductase [Propionibacterium freudenreichii]